MNIAYVDDDKDSLQVFARRFQREGVSCDGFESAEQAAERLATGPYDVFVVDVRLPGISGVELLSRLRERGVHTPCVLITAFSHLGYMKQAVNSGANYLLEKPFKYEDLKRVIAKVLEPPASLHYFLDRELTKIGLTKREEETARLLLKGLSNGEIARVASLSEKTVKQYLTQVYEKAGVRSRAEFFSHIFPI